MLRMYVEGLEKDVLSLSVDMDDVHDIDMIN